MYIYSLLINKQISQLHEMNAFFLFFDTSLIKVKEKMEVLRIY